VGLLENLPSCCSFMFASDGLGVVVQHAVWKVPSGHAACITRRHAAGTAVLMLPTHITTWRSS